MRKLPYGRQCIEDDDIEAVVDVLKSDYLTTGPAVQRFEESLSKAVDAPYAVACANGTAALHLAAMSIDLAPGDAVIVPAITFVATANVARFCGAEVVFADVDPGSGLVTPDCLERALASIDSELSPAAVIPVHLNGQSCDMEAISKLAGQHRLRVIEDACHAIGTIIESNQTVVGDCRFSDAACFSFHPVKTVAMGEGGAVTTRDEAMAKRLSMLRNHGLTRDAADFENAELARNQSGDVNRWYYEMQSLGFNYRSSDINAALGEAQLRKLSRFVTRRRELAAHYDGLLAGLDLPIRPVSRVPGQQPGWHLYAVQVDYSSSMFDRESLMQRLADAGIYTQVHYIPVYRQPYYRKRYGEIALAGAEDYYKRVLALPLFPQMQLEDVEYVVEKLQAIFRD